MLKVLKTESVRTTQMGCREEDDEGEETVLEEKERLCKRRF